MYGRDFCKVIHSVDEFKKEFLKKRYKNKIVYAHNAEYDLSGIFGNIYLMDPDAIFNGKFITCTNGNCKFADSYNLLPTSVEKLGELTGNKKKKLGAKKDKEGNIISSVKNFETDIKYCITDCKIVYDALFKMFSDSEPSFTIGSLSLKKFRADFLRETIKINELSDHFFECLYGGRTEAFRLGKVKANVYDINSAYPFVMRNLKFPDPSRLRIADNSMFEYYLHNRDYEGMIEATVQVHDSVYIPALPYRTPDSLIFPVGTFRGSWTFNEFRYAIENSSVTVLKVHKLIISEAIDSIFTPYIDHYYKLRSETDDEFEKYYYKLFMNNLYGKLIQRIHEKFRFCTSVSDAKKYMKEKNLKHVHLQEVNDGYFLKYEVDEILSHTIACWGAYITAEVRKLLHIGLTEYPKQVVYCDTDSRAIEKNLNINSKKLGGWKKEKKYIVNVRALKDYVYSEYNEEKKKWETKEALKGIKRGSFQMDEFSNVFKIKRMIKTRESFRRVDNLPPGTFVEQIKVLTGDYNKRIKLKNGFTKPIKLYL